MPNCPFFCAYCVDGAAILAGSGKLCMTAVVIYDILCELLPTRWFFNAFAKNWNPISDEK